jgi:hypothetical protein
VKTNGPSPRIAHAAGLAALIAAESVLFLTAARHHYAWSYPRWNDQVQYLGQAYNGYELARHGGFPAAAWSMLTSVSAQGCLHGIVTLPLFALAGPSRTAALAANMLAFGAWQVATFLAVRRVSGRASLAWASVGLLSALHFPWSGGAGTAVDFRLDWMAACAYGITLAVAISGRGFRSSPWAVALGIATGMTVLLRFLTAVYFGVIFLALLGCLMAQRDRWARSARLALSGAVALGIFAPAFWRNRWAIYNYYWLDHFAGPMRALHDSRLGAQASVKWVLSQVVFNQVGVPAFVLGLGAAAVLWAMRRAPEVKGRMPVGETHPSDGAWEVAIAFFAVPAAVLACHPIKADPPASILLPGAIWIIFLLWIRLARDVSRKTAIAVCACVLAIGSAAYVSAETGKQEIDRHEADYRAINGLADYLFFRSEEAGLEHPRVGVSWIVDGIDAGALRILGYERHGRMLPFIATLPTGLLPTSREIAMTALVNSHFVCLVNGATPVWPFDRQMAQLLPEMRRWCVEHMAYAGQMDTAEFSVSVFEERSFGPQVAGAGLAPLLKAASSGPAYAPPGTPAPPFFVSSPYAVGSTAVKFSYRIAAAHSPLRYRAESLPQGLALDSEKGEISGRFPRTGVFAAEVSAFNRSGETRSRLEIHVEAEPWYAFLDAPSECRVGVPFDVKFGAFDAKGTLNFIDITDLTTRTLLERLQVSEDERQTWSGIHELMLSKPGRHTVLMRFVRYDPGVQVPYSYLDHAFTIDAGAGH